MILDTLPVSLVHFLWTTLKTNTMEMQVRPCLRIFPQALSRIAADITLPQNAIYAQQIHSVLISFQMHL